MFAADTVNGNHVLGEAVLICKWNQEVQSIQTLARDVIAGPEEPHAALHHCERAGDTSCGRAHHTVLRAASRPGCARHLRGLLLHAVLLPLSG